MDVYYASYTGMTRLIGASGTLSRGSRPSNFLLRWWLEPDASITLQRGTLTFTGTRGTISLPRCVPLPGTLRHKHRDDGGVVVSILVQDQRAAWTQVASGIYNVRYPDGTIDPATKKNLRELASIIIGELGESSYSVDSVPEDVYPRVSWNQSPCGSALERLGDLVAADISIGNDGEVGLICRGQGADPGGSYPEMTPRYSIIPGDTPSSVVVACGPTWHQTLFLLEAVGLEADGTVVPIDDLSYKPEEGWGWPTLFSYVAQESRHLAFESVFRWYRIKEISGGGLELPQTSYTVTDIRQFLPLGDFLLESGTTESGGKEFSSPYVVGEHWPHSDDAENTSIDCRVQCPFELDKERGIVIFETFVGKFDADALFPCDNLYLMVTHRVKDADSGEYESYTQDTTLGGSDKPMYLRHPEMFRAVTHSFSNVGDAPDSYTDNLTELNAEASSYLSCWSAAYQSTLARRLHLDGLIPLFPDGTVSQVSWTVGNGQRASTDIGVRHEFDPHEPSELSRKRASRIEYLQAESETAPA